MSTGRVLLTLLLLAVLPQMGQAETRHAAQVRRFKQASGYPAGRVGYVVDHIIPLCAGGADRTSNMQWQALAASYQKDAFERALCAAMRQQGYVLTFTRSHRPGG